MIPVYRPWIGQAEARAVARVLRSGWLGLGPVTAEFESRFARYAGAPHAVATSSGTAALHLALLAAGVGSGDDVILPAFTFVATAEAVLMCGARPVFADIDPGTLNLDPADVRRKLTGRTRAILPVHYGGLPCDLEALRKVARRGRRVALVEDAAHACGSSYRGRRIGVHGDFVCFSFHAVKNLTTGEGGMITTADGKAATRLRRLRVFGIDRDAWARHRTKPRGRLEEWRYQVNEPGFKAHLHDLSAAIGLVQLAKLDRGNGIRRAIAQRYDQAFRALPGVTLRGAPAGAVTNHHLYVIDIARRDLLLERLRRRGIAAGVHYEPTHLLRAFRRWRVPLPVTERVWRRLVSLPIYPTLGAADQGRVIRGVAEFVE